MGLFGRILKGIATGGASEIVRSKRIKRAVLSGGLSEVIGRKRSTKKSASKINTASVLSQSAFRIFLKKKNKL